MTGRHHAPEDLDGETVSFTQIAAEARGAHLGDIPAERFDEQVNIAAWYLTTHGQHPSAIMRAAVILRAQPGDLACTRHAGITIAAEREGKTVRCTACGNRYDCLPENPAFTDPADPKALWCLSCLLIETRDPVVVAALEPTAVHPPRKRRPKAPVVAITEETEES